MVLGPAQTSFSEKAVAACVGRGCVTSSRDLTFAGPVVGVQRAGRFADTPLGKQATRASGVGSRTNVIDGRSSKTVGVTRKRGDVHDGNVAV